MQYVPNVGLTTLLVEALAPETILAAGRQAGGVVVRGGSDARISDLTALNADHRHRFSHRSMPARKIAPQHAPRIVKVLDKAKDFSQREMVVCDLTLT